MNAHTYYAFSDELQKLASPATWAAGHAARLGRGIENVGVETAKLVRDSAHPKHIGRGLREGFEAMGNMTKGRKESMQNLLSGERGVLNTMADAVRSPEGIARSKAKAKEIGSHYRADYHTGTGVMDKLRRRGIMSGAAKYEGPSKIRKARNMARRALPGEAAVNVAQIAGGSYRGLKETEDPTTGRKIGLGERIGRAGMGATTGIVGMRSGFVAGMAGSAAGEAIGGRVGRAGDAVAGKLRGKHQTPTGAAPHPTGAG